MSSRIVNIKNNLLNILRESKYRKWLSGNIVIIFTFALISTFLCILTYPGVIYSDSYDRISMASSLKTIIHAFFDGNADLTYGYKSWLTVLPSIFIAVSINIVGSIVLYTFMQCLAFWVITYYFGKSLSEGKHSWWNLLCIFVCPVIWGYSVYYEAGVLCAVAMIAMLILIWKYESFDSVFDRLLTVVFITFFSLICFGYRANAFTIIPALIFIIAVKYWKKIKGLVLSTAIIAGFSLTIIIPNALQINTMSSFAASFVWETVSAIQMMDDEKQEEYITYLDDIFGEGLTQAAVDHSTFAEPESTIIPMFFKSITPSMISEPGNPSRILKKYVKFALKEPGTFMRMKWEFISHTLGIGKAIVFREYYYDRWKKMPEFGFNDSGPRKAFVYYLKSYMTYMKIFCMPWLMYAAALALILIKRFGFKEVEGSLCFSESAFLVSVFYYGAYIIDTQAFEFRYFFPSWLILFLIICNLSADICFRKKYTRRILEIALVVWVSIGLLGGYRLYTELGRDTIRNVHANGTLLFENEMNRVYYLDGKIYFIAERNADTNYKFFLHYYPADGEMINNDFDFNDKKIATAFWDQKIAAADLPDQKIQNVEFGQYYYSKRFWEHTADISSLYDEMKR